jgi:tungstate transport system ATP-binding protein
MAEPLVALRDVRVQHGAATVLDIPALEIREGEIVAIIGANGAGKSTLLRVLGLLEWPTCGGVLFRGEAATAKKGLAMRRHMASVLQAPLLLDATVYANAALGLKLRGVPSRQVDPRLRPWLERLGIAHLANRPARTLSGGEARRTSLARGLVLEPELLLLDEPFSALDAPSRETLLLDLQEILAQTEAAVVMVTHDLHEAAALGKRIGVLSRGMLMQLGLAEEIFSRPVNDEVAAISWMDNRIPAVVAEIVPGGALARFDGGAVFVVGAYSIGARVTLWVRSEDIELGSDWVCAAQGSVSIRARIRRVSTWTSHYRVVLQTDCGSLVALVAKSRLVALDLREGGDAVASFKPTAVCEVEQGLAR